MLCSGFISGHMVLFSAIVFAALIVLTFTCDKLDFVRFFFFKFHSHLLIFPYMLPSGYSVKLLACADVLMWY